MSIFTTYIWMGGGGEQGQSFRLMSNGTTYDKLTVITCLEIMIKEVISIMSDVNEIVFFSDGTARQFQNRSLLQHLTMMMDVNVLEITWNYFASSHGMGVADVVGGTLKKRVCTEIMAGARCSAAQEFVDICHPQKIPGISSIQRQDHIHVWHMNVIEYTRYFTSDSKHVFRFYEYQALHHKLLLQSRSVLSALAEIHLSIF